MKLSQIKILFQEEIPHIYSKSEIDELFSVFCGHFLKMNKMELRNNTNLDISDSDSSRLIDAISALKTGKPFQQILGETEFYGMRFFVDENVLIPRPETEELLELAIKKIKERFTAKTKFKILDIGTGSGVIPIVLKTHFPDALVSAIDISSEALEIAKKNADFHNTEINFVQKDYLNEAFDSAEADNEIYDVIISNPPYIGIEENADIEHSVKGFEPNIALFSPTSDALIFYRKIAADCKNHLAENGLLFLEINQKLGKETLELYQNGFSEVQLLKDISGNDRLIFGIR